MNQNITIINEMGVKISYRGANTEPEIRLSCSAHIV